MLSNRRCHSPPLRISRERRRPATSFWGSKKQIRERALQQMGKILSKGANFFEATSEILDRHSGTPMRVRGQFVAVASLLGIFEMPQLPKWDGGSSAHRLAQCIWLAEVRGAACSAVMLTRFFMLEQRRRGHCARRRCSGGQGSAGAAQLAVLQAWVGLRA